MTVPPRAQPITKQAGSPSDDYRDQFLTILNNRGKVEKGRDLPIREKGFVVLARDGLDLKPLQSLCTDTRQTWNVCLTARYRMRPGAIFGTLLVAFWRDLERVHRGITDEVVGDLSPGAADSAWEEFLKRAGSDMRWGLPKYEDEPPLTKRQLDQLLNILSLKGTLPEGKRLVLFAEVDDSEVAADKQEWEMAARTLFDRLPERVGLVFSGAPADFRLDADKPHFLELTLPKDDGSEPPYEGIRFKQSALHSDQPADKDALDVKNFAEALARFVMHPQTEPPLTIGIHGPWGKGKSTFMNLVQDSLLEQALVWQDERSKSKLTQLKGEIEREVEQGLETLNARLRRRHREKTEEYVRLREELAAPRVLTVDFNAWQYEDARQIWAGLASKISARLERFLPRWGHVLMRIRYAWKERLSELLLYVILPLLVGLVILVLYLAFGDPGQSGMAAENAARGDLVLRDLFAVFVPFGSSLFLIWFATKQFLSVAQPLSERVLSYIQLPTYREQMGYQHRVMDDLRFVYGSLERHGLESKVVVFIDDLDRCSEEKIMEVLQAIVLILGDSEFFVFLGMDTEMIHRAIRVHYTLHQGEARPLPEDFPEEYLRKIVQVSFNLPEATEDARRAYLDSLFSERSRQQAIEEPAQSGTTVTPNETARTNGNEGQAARDTPPPTAVSLPSDLGHLHQPQPLEVEDTPAELETFRKHLNLLKDNPRELKRLINLHRLVKIILQTDQQSVSQENEQRMLVRWLIICARWPDLIKAGFEKAEKAEMPPEPAALMTALVADLKSTQDDDEESLQLLDEFAKSGDPWSAQDVKNLKLAALISTLAREAGETPNSGDQDEAANSPVQTEGSRKGP